MSWSARSASGDYLYLSLYVAVPAAMSSALYVSINSLCVSMHDAHAWSGFGKSAKTLRVSSPTGDQRKTYCLQIPWTYGIVCQVQ